jgi:hypothetical protein
MKCPHDLMPHLAAASGSRNQVYFQQARLIRISKRRDLREPGMQERRRAMSASSERQT